MNRKYQNWACLSVIGALLSTAGAQSARATCSDPWITQAMKEVTQSTGSPNRNTGARLTTSRIPSGSGNSGECSPDYYARNNGRGHWSSYQDLMNKVRVKVTGGGAAYIFIAPNQAGFMGHMGWGYVGNDGRYVFGSTANGTGAFEIAAGQDNGFEWSSSDTEKEMFQWMRGRYQNFWTYTRYKVVPVARRDYNAATNAAYSTKSMGFKGIGNNCLDHTMLILRAYGVSNMPSATANPSPTKWFDAFSGSEGQMDSAVRGRGATTQTVTEGEGTAEDEATAVAGHQFLMPSGPSSAISRSEATLSLTDITSAFVVPKGAPSYGQKLSLQSNLLHTPKTRGVITADSTPGLKGISKIFQYTNEGAPDSTRASGQAAIATLLSRYNYSFREPGPAFVREIWIRFAPDIPAGMLGTSWKQMERGLKAYGLPFKWGEGEANLKAAIASGRPCILALDTTVIPETGWKNGSGHWTVAYAYDDENIYLTNWIGSSLSSGGKCSWNALRKSWNTDLTRSNKTANLFICPLS